MDKHGKFSRKCENCKHYEPQSTYNGECRYAPPVPVRFEHEVGIDWHCPLTKAQSVCSFHKFKDGRDDYTGPAELTRNRDL
jgi:hypothetical protein